MLRDITDQIADPGRTGRGKGGTLNERDEALQAREKAVEELLAADAQRRWRFARKKTTGATKQKETAVTAQSAAGLGQCGAGRRPAIAGTAAGMERDPAGESNRTPDLGPTLDVLKKSVTDLQKRDEAGAGPAAGDREPADPGRQTRTSSRSTALDRLQKAREYVDSRIFERDSLPLVGGDTAAPDRREQRSFSERDQSPDGHSRLRRPDRRRDCFSGILLLVLSLFGAYQLQSERRRAGCRRTRTQAEASAYRPPLDCAGRAAAAAVRLSAGAAGAVRR